MFGERDIISPAHGEIIAARYIEDDYWYRARVLESKGDILNVSSFFFSWYTSIKSYNSSFSESFKGKAIQLNENTCHFSAIAQFQALDR